MRYETFLIFLIFALIPWFGLCKKKLSKVTDIKFVADTNKDFLTNVNKMNLPALMNEEFVKYLYIAASLGSIVSVFIGMAQFYYQKQEKDEIKAAIQDLSVKLDSLSNDVKYSMDKIIAFQIQIEFQREVTFPAQKLLTKYKGYLKSVFIESMVEAEKLTLKEGCKDFPPMNSFVSMEVLLNTHGNTILLSKEYTDEAFKTLKTMYASAMKELTLLYFTCEGFNFNSTLNKENMKIFTDHHIEKVKHISSKIFKIFDRIDEERADNVWEIMPNKLIDWHLAYSKSKNRTYYVHGPSKNVTHFSRIITEKLNSHIYLYFRGYNFTAGIANYKKKYLDKFLYFDGCERDTCAYKAEKDVVIWVLRTKNCHNRKLHINKCLQFEMQLYRRFNNEFDATHKNLKALITMFKRNCKIANAIGFYSYDKKLEGNTKGHAPYAHANGYTMEYHFKTDKPHHKYPNYYPYNEDLLVFTDCAASNNNNELSFDFIKEYCKSDGLLHKLHKLHKGQVCVLKEEAYNLHRLTDKTPTVYINHPPGK